MASIPKVTDPGFPDIHVLEEGEPVVGGLDGVDNLPHRQLAERTDHLRARAEALETARADHEDRLATVETSGSVSVGRAFLLWQGLSDEGAAYELFGDAAYSWRDVTPVPVLETIAGDESLDVDGTAGLAVGGHYVLFDPSSGTVHETLELAQVLTARRVRATAPLTHAMTDGLLARTNWTINPGHALAASGTFFSEPLRTLRYDDDGRVLIRRDAGDGTLSVQARRVSDPRTGWVDCPLKTSAATAAGDVDQEYTVPLGGTIELRIDSMPGEDGAAIRIEHMVLLTSVRAERADAVRRPTAVAPADGATDVMETPVLETGAYYSLYGVPQAGFDVRIATDADMANVVYSGTEDTAAVRHTVAAGHLIPDGVYWWQARHRDAEGTGSPWSAAVGFTTGSVFQYVRPPLIGAPAADATGVSLTPTIVTVPFAPVGAEDTHAASRYQIATDGAFTAIVYDSGESADLTAHPVPTDSALPRNMSLFLRARHKGATIGWSDWSMPRAFTTCNTGNAPTITGPTAGATIGLTPTITLSAYAMPGGSDAHVASQYRITSADGQTTLYDSGEVPDLTSHTVAEALPTLTDVRITARQKGATTGWTPWSEAVACRTAAPSGSIDYTTAGTYTFTVPDDVSTLASVLVIGAGGGGGRECNGGGGGGGGGGGAVYLSDVSVTPGDTYSVVVGALGAPANSGGTSSFGSLASATGGGAGKTGGRPEGRGGTGGAGGQGVSTEDNAILGVGGEGGQGNPVYNVAAVDGGGASWGSNVSDHPAQAGGDAGELTNQGGAFVAGGGGGGGWDEDTILAKDGTGTGESAGSGGVGRGAGGGGGGCTSSPGGQGAPGYVRVEW